MCAHASTLQFLKPFVVPKSRYYTNAALTWQDTLMYETNITEQFCGNIDVIYEQLVLVTSYMADADVDVTNITVALLEMNFFKKLNH